MRRLLMASTILMCGITASFAQGQSPPGSQQQMQQSDEGQRASSERGERDGDRDRSERGDRDRDRSERGDRDRDRSERGDRVRDRGYRERESEGRRYYGDRDRDRDDRDRRDWTGVNILETAIVITTGLDGTSGFVPKMKMAISTAGIASRWRPE